MPTLNDKRRRVLAALQQHITNHQHLPTDKQLATAAGIPTASAAREELGWLLLNGYLQHDNTQPGGIRIVAGGPA